MNGLVEGRGRGGGGVPHCLDCVFSFYEFPSSPYPQLTFRALSGSAASQCTFHCIDAFFNMTILIGQMYATNVNEKLVKYPKQFTN